MPSNLGFGDIAYCSTNLPIGLKDPRCRQSKCFSLLSPDSYLGRENGTKPVEALYLLEKYMKNNLSVERKRESNIHDLNLFLMSVSSNK